MTALRYTPGAWRAVVTPQGVAVLPSGVDPAMLESIWRALDTGNGLGAVLEALTGAFGTSLRSIPPFAVATVDGAGVRLAVRGELAIEVEEEPAAGAGPGGSAPASSGAAGSAPASSAPAGSTHAGAPLVVSGADVTTWSERVVASARRVTVRTPVVPAGADWFPIASGVVLVAAVTLQLADDVAGPLAPARVPAPEPLVAPGEVHEPAPALAPDAVPEVAHKPAPTPVPDAAPKAGAVPEMAAAPEVAHEPAPTPVPGAVPEMAAAPEHTVVPEETILPGNDGEAAPAQPTETAEALDVEEAAGTSEAAEATNARGATQAGEAAEGADALESTQTGQATEGADALESAQAGEAAAAGAAEAAEELEHTRNELPDDAYDHLWGATVVKSVEEAAVRDLDDEEEEPAGQAPAPAPAPAPAGASSPAAAATPTAGFAPPTVPSVAAPAAAAPVTSGGLIDGIPDFGGVGASSTSASLVGRTVPPASRPTASPAAPAPAPAAAPAPAESAFTPGDDHDGLTVTVSELEAMRRLGAAQSAAPAAPNGSLGRIVLNTGETHTLDRPVIIGRRPRANRVQADQVPVLVTVASPEQDISRNHLEVRLEGRHVLVVDLATTNGSVLHREGTPPLRLGPNEPVLVLSGDVVDIGDGVTVAFEEIA